MLLSASGRPVMGPDADQRVWTACVGARRGPARPGQCKGLGPAQRIWSYVGGGAALTSVPGPGPARPACVAGSARLSAPGPM